MTSRSRIALLAVVITLCGAHARAQQSAPAPDARQLDVAPFTVLGSGRPGTLPADIDKPDGLEFAGPGILLVTDAGNHRVQAWDVRTGARICEFGREIFGGEITNVAVAPDRTVYVADSVLNLVYVFRPGTAGACDYEFVGTRFGEQGFKKLGGIVVDSRGRLYVVDGKLWEVRRYLPDGKPDPAWKFERTLADGDTVLHRCEGVAVDEARGLLYVASESDHIVKVFDLETGAFKRRLVGEGVFTTPVEGLAIAQDRLFAVDEDAGRVRIFALGGGEPEYLGCFGEPARVNFDVDDSPNPDFDLKRRVTAGEVIPGIVNVAGLFCSPDEIAVQVDPATGETWIAIADQCNYRVVVYRWSDVVKVLSGADHR